MTALTSTIVCLVFGIITFIFYNVTFVSQIVQLHKNRNTSGTSLLTYIFYTISSVIWAIWAYGFYFNMLAQPTDQSVPLLLKHISILPTVVTNTITVFLMSTILIIKLRHLHLAKVYKVSEIQLSETLLKSDKDITSFKKNLFYILLFGFVLLLLVVLITCLLLFTTPVYTGQPSEWIWVIIFNWLAAASSEIINWPQFIKSLKVKDMTGVSLGWSLFLFINCLAFIGYDTFLGISSTGGFSNLVIGSIILCGFTPTIGVLILKLKNMINAKKLNMTELEYTKKYILKK